MNKVTLRKIRNELERIPDNLEFTASQLRHRIVENQGSYGVGHAGSIAYHLKLFSEIEEANKKHSSNGKTKMYRKVVAWKKLDSKKRK